MRLWYLAHRNELMIDLDEYLRPSKSGEAWGEVFFRRRLREAIIDGLLPVKSVHLIPSSTPKHFHAIVKLKQPMPTLNRLIWQLHLGSDLYRGRADLMRYAKGYPAPSLLITPRSIPNFRNWDYLCDCDKKHVTEEQFSLGEACCPVWKMLRGASPWQLFGQSSRAKESEVNLPVGEVPLKLIMAKELIK